MGTTTYLPDYQTDTLPKNRQNWFDNCPIARTRETARPLRPGFRVRVWGDSVCSRYPLHQCSYRSIFWTHTSTLILLGLCDKSISGRIPKHPRQSSKAVGVCVMAIKLTLAIFDDYRDFMVFVKYPHSSPKQSS